jgi:hypothetical protein
VKDEWIVGIALVFVFCRMIDVQHSRGQSGMPASLARESFRIVSCGMEGTRKMTTSVHASKHRKRQGRWPLRHRAGLAYKPLPFLMACYRQTLW